VPVPIPIFLLAQTQQATTTGSNKKGWEVSLYNTIGGGK
jgi:hypothetical protein